jgi:siroheme synthase-like protein
MSQPRALFPMMVNLEGRKCVVVGAGRVASRKIAELLKCGAKVVVISPRAAPTVQRYVSSGALIWRRRIFSSRDVEGAFLAVAATGSPQVNQAVFSACAAHGVLCNAVDEPEHCHFYYPAVVRRGALQIAISTGGRSPALAARLRRDLENQFDTRWGPWLEHLGKLRGALLRAEMSEAKRKKQLLQMAGSDAFHRFVRERAKSARAGQQRRRQP